LVEGEATIPNANTADIPNIFLKKLGALLCHWMRIIYCI